jgi:hypothetical protein
MSYDVESGERVCMPSVPSADPRDLEALVMLLELAALYLTDSPDSTFTATQLLDEARKIAGEDLAFDENDMRIALANAGFLKRETGGRLRLR